MAIVKATYTKSSTGTKASIRYIQHRAGKDGERVSRTLFNSDGLMGRFEAYRMLDEAQEGSYFYRIVLSPDPHTEDAKQDLYLRLVTEQTMQQLEEQVHGPVHWVGVIHADHAPHRHVHVVAVVLGRLQVQDFAALRKAATEACWQQRRELELTRAQQQEAGEEAQWVLGY